MSRAQRAELGVVMAGVPFSSTGRPDGIAEGIGALRAAGLVERVGAQVGLRDVGDLSIGEQTPQRGPSGLANETGLAALIRETREVVAAARSQHERSLLVGGDCPVMLGALAALVAVHGRCGLLMLDGHEDAYPPHASSTGEASDSELAIALGRVDDLPAGVSDVSGVLRAQDVVLLGARDADELGAEGVPSLAPDIGMFASAEDVAAEDPAQLARAAAGWLRDVAAWWLHIDLDVLRTADFPAADYLQPGGLTWQQLTALACRVWRDARCAGASVVIYNPDLDHDRSVARRTVAFVGDVLRA